MSRFYANITLGGADQAAVVALLKTAGAVAYVSPAVRQCVVIFHEDLGGQETLAADCSAALHCPALLVMAFGEAVLLYRLYEEGKVTDAYVSQPSGDLELDGDPPPGDASRLCAAFEAERFERRVQGILSKETRPDTPYAYAANRHGELARALKLPLFAAGTGFNDIELGEVPAGADFDLRQLVRTP